MENLTNEEIEQVLEAGLEKVAYEQGVEEYTNSLIKVAEVHGVDPEALHNFLEAEEMEKKASDEELEEYVSSLEKVAAIHGVDSEELHNFLMKEAAEEEEASKVDKIKNYVKENPGKVGAGVGAAGLGALGLRHANNVSKDRDFLRNQVEAFKGRFPEASSQERKDTIRKGVGVAKGIAGLGAAGVGAGLGAAAGKGAAAAADKVKKKDEKKKTASFGDLDEETLNALFEKGVEALSE